MRMYYLSRTRYNVSDLVRHTYMGGGDANECLDMCVFSALVFSEFTSQELWHDTQISDQQSRNS